MNLENCQLYIKGQPIGICDANVNVTELKSTENFTLSMVREYSGTLENVQMSEEFKHFLHKQKLSQMCHMKYKGRLKL